MGERQQEHKPQYNQTWIESASDQHIEFDGGGNRCAGAKLMDQAFGHGGTWGPNMIPENDFTAIRFGKGFRIDITMRKHCSAASSRYRTIMLVLQVSGKGQPSRVAHRLQARHCQFPHNATQVKSSSSVITFDRTFFFQGGFFVDFGGGLFRSQSVMAIDGQCGCPATDTHEFIFRFCREHPQWKYGQPKIFDFTKCK